MAAVLEPEGLGGPVTHGISEEQWAAAKGQFEAALTDTCGITEEKYDNITYLLGNWDVLTPKERREVGGGNQAYWAKKYTYVEVEGQMELLCAREGAGAAAGEEDGGLDLTTAMRVSHHGRMFDDIKEIHLNSEQARPSAHISAPRVMLCSMRGEHTHTCCMDALLVG